MDRPLTIREIQLIELEIAKEIKRICEKCSIPYFIVGGTLLGAVRHKGFIPWDDDMDIGMSYDNYKKFLKVAKLELNKEYLLQEWNDGTPFGYPYAKVKMKGTCVIEEASKKLNIDKGVWVDVFPHIPVSKERAKSKWLMIKLQLISKGFLLKRGYDLNCLTVNRMSKLLNNCLKWFPVSDNTLSNKLMSLLLTTSENSLEYYIECDGMFKGNFVFPIKYFDKLTILDFEDTQFPAPFMYHEYLTNAYGEYLTPPPVSERMKGHSIIKATITEK